MTPLEQILSKGWKVELSVMVQSYGTTDNRTPTIAYSVTNSHGEILVGSYTAFRESMHEALGTVLEKVAYRITVHQDAR